MAQHPPTFMREMQHHASREACGPLKEQKTDYKPDTSQRHMIINHACNDEVDDHNPAEDDHDIKDFIDAHIFSVLIGFIHCKHVGAKLSQQGPS